MNSAPKPAHPRAPDDADALVAAIDVGTNTVLCLVARSDREHALVVVEDRCVTPRLGAGLARRGTLDAAAMQRTEDVLCEYALRLDVVGVSRERTRVVGTAAMRRARDGGDFVRRIRERARLEIEILSEEEEARLSYLGARSSGAPADSIVIDVGGGSTEIVFDAGHQRRSVPIGAVVLTETYMSERPIESGGWDGLVAAVQAAIHGLARGSLSPANASTSLVLVGGTPMNWACLELGLNRFDLRAAEGVELSTRGIREWADRLAVLTTDARTKFPIERERVEILPAGLACLAGAVEWVGAERARVSGRGLRFGVVAELLSAFGSARSV